MAPSSLAAVAAQAPNTSPCSPHTSAARPDDRPITQTFNAAERMLACPSQAREMARAVHANNDGSDLYLRTLISFEVGACRCGADVSQFPFPRSGGNARWPRGRPTYLMACLVALRRRIGTGAGRSYAQRRRSSGGK